jgi:catechol 2,3-dioxygenase-like lactoylglutathione lyase family enzyme
MIKEANVTVMVSDLNRAIKFYTETLGLKLVSQYQTHWAEIQAPGLEDSILLWTMDLNLEIQKVLL